MEQQTRTDSFMEAMTNVVIGFGINFIANILVLPTVLGVPVNLAELGTIGIIFTVISVVRSYTLRRMFNGRTVWQAIKDRFGRGRTSALSTKAREGRLIKGS
jgi:uncharacterized membrane protein (DUF485 family)